jgi:hypothetical protein
MSIPITCPQAAPGGDWLTIDQPIEIVGERNREHPPGGDVPCAPKVEARLDAARPLYRELGLGQVDLMRGEHELRVSRERVGELEVDRRSIRRKVDQRRVRNPTR